MMRKIILFAIMYSTSLSVALAQRGGQEWLTSNVDPQHTGWIRSDTKISKETVQKPAFQFLWKMKLDNEPKQLHSLMQPVLLDRLIGYRGFKSLAFIAASSDTLYAIDDDLARVYWKTRFNTTTTPQGGSILCPGGLTAAATRPATLTPLALGRGFGGNRINAARAMVGEPNQGSPDILGRSSNAPPVPPPQPAQQPLQPTPAPGGFGGAASVNSVYVLASDGMVHQLSVQTGKDVVMEPAKFLPPNANASALLLVDNVLYTSTSNQCGGVPNGVWAMDLSGPEKTVTSWKTAGANVVGSVNPTLGSDGTVYVTTAESVVALEPKTLKQRDYFTQPNANFTASPLVFQDRGKDLIAVAGQDGRIYILNSTLLGGNDHQTPLSATSVATNNTGFSPSALASWEDADGTRWILAPANTAIAAFKVVEQNGIPGLQPGWVSPQMLSPMPPIIINGVVFALSSGEYRAGGTPMTAAQRAQRSKPAILYALDASTGTELWNSGNTITSFAHSGGLAGGFGQVYVATYDSTFYTFGFPIEK